MTRHPFRPPVRRILDRFRMEDIPKSKRDYLQRLKYEWEYYSEVAFQRAQILEDIRKEIIEQSSGPFKIQRWQRAVKYEYALSPLSARGSLKAPGGRFNIGQIDTRFPTFPAVYIAKTQETAMDELLSRNAKGELLPFEELALTHKASITIVAVNGELESVFDLRDEKKLARFVELTGHFKLSDKLKALARDLQLPLPRVICSNSELLKSFLDPNWRFLPMQMDIPANSQLFGQMVEEAGINGILYPSALSGEDCLAFFPRNLAHSKSWLEIPDSVPNEIVCKRLDSKSGGLIF